MAEWSRGAVGSCRRELLDHVIVMDERHLKRLVSDYISYYHDDRTHLGLSKQTPGTRARSNWRGRVISRSRLGGLYHRYERVCLKWASANRLRLNG